LVRACGIDYEEFGCDSYLDSQQFRQDMIDVERGFAAFMARSNLLDLESMFYRLLSLSERAAVLISTPLVMTAHLVAQARRIPFVSCSLSPAMLLASWGKETIDPHAAEWRRRLADLRSKIGLPRLSFPQMGRFYADLTLGIYPRCLADSGETFLREVHEIGYPYLEIDEPESEDLLRWMEQHPCVLVTFGSYVDGHAVEIFDHCRRAAAVLGFRLLFVSQYAEQELVRRAGANESIRIERYIPHASAMRRAAVVVHHCGIGTLAAGVASHQPMVAMPFGLDQNYNAELLQRRDLLEVVAGHDVSFDMLLGALQRALEHHSRRESAWACWRDDRGEKAAVRAVGVVEDSAR
jgi:UDP:flavonoid glycosyltransferase YjiC (YdhE family)